MPYSARGLGHALEPLELLLGLLLGLLRHAGLLDRLAQLGDLGRLLVALAQLLLDLAQLLAQDVLALLRRQRLLGLLADLAWKLEHLDALRQQRQHLVEALLDVERLQHLLLFRRLGVHDAGDEVGERGGRGQARRSSPPAPAARSAAAASPRAARSCSRPTRASISGVSTSEMPISSTRATRNGKPGRNSTHAEAPHAAGRSHDGCRRAAVT